MYERTATKRNQTGSITIWLLAAVVVVAIIVAGYLVYHHSHHKSTLFVAKNRPGVISSLQFSSFIDKNGYALKPASQFVKNTRLIYAVVTLDNAKAGTLIQYVRYYNGIKLSYGSVTEI